MTTTNQPKIQPLFHLLIIIFCVSNIQAQWNQSSVGTDGIKSIYFINSDTGYVAGVGGRIYKTNNGGTTWSSIRTGSQQINDIYFPTADTGYAVNAIGQVLYTYNGGQGWGSNSLMRASLYSVHFINSNIGFAVGQSTNGSFNGATIGKTMDAGATWTIQNFQTNSSLSRIQFVDDSIGYAVGFNFSQRDGVVLKTTNGGISWTEQNVTDSTNTLIFRGAFFTNRDTGFIVGQHIAGANQSAVIYTTTDGGSTWAFQLVANRAELYDIQFINDSLGYAVGLYFGQTGCGESLILKTTNGGNTWSIDYTNPLVYGLVSITAPDPNTIYTVESCFGPNTVGNFLKNTGTILDTPQPRWENDLLIYPNPTSNQLNIDTPFEINSITITDITGQTLPTIIANTNQVEVSNLPSGIYFINIYTENRIISKKFIKQ